VDVAGDFLAATRLRAGAGGFPGAARFKPRAVEFSSAVWR
jgi:hypothetical protein